MAEMAAVDNQKNAPGVEAGLTLGRCSRNLAGTSGHKKPLLRQATKAAGGAAAEALSS